MTTPEPDSEFERRLAGHILVIDGAMGTMVQTKGLVEADFRGDRFSDHGQELKGDNELLTLTRPDVIEGIHSDFLEAGADIIETNTFGSAALVLAEYPPLHEQAYEITLAGARLAREAADRYPNRFVAGSMGPTTKAISVTGGVTFAELIETFRDQTRALLDGGVDYLLLETQQDTRNIKAGLIGIAEAFELGGRVARAPVGVRRVDEDEARQQGLVAHAALGLAGGAERAERVAVIAAVAGDDLEALRAAGLGVVLASDLEGRLVGLGAAAREVGLALEAELLDQRRRQPDGRLVAEGQRRVGQTRHLLTRYVGELLPAVAHVHAPQARHPVEQAPPLRVGDEAAGAGDDQRRRRLLEGPVLADRVPEALAVLCSELSLRHRRPRDAAPYARSDGGARRGAGA